MPEVMIYVLYGIDSYRSREKLREIIEQYRAKTEGVYDFHQFDVEDDPIDKLEQAAQSASLFQKKKLIVIERASKGNESFLKKLKEWAKDWQEDTNTIVVFWDDADKKGFSKILAILKDAKTQEYGPMTLDQERRFAAEFLKENKLTLAPKTIEQILEAAHGDTWRIANELSKVSLGGDVGAKTFDDDRAIFALLDVALINPRHALMVLERMRSVGVNEHYIISALINHVRLLLLIAEGKGLGPEENAHPFVIQKAREKVRHINLSRIRSVFEKLFLMDAKIKTGAQDPYIALVRLLITA